MATNPLVRLGELGQSPWYDFITRDLIASGELARLIREDGLRGLTSNPTIFEKAVASSSSYDDDIRRLAEAGRTPAEIFEAIAVDDVRAACAAFHGAWEAAGGADGLVSIEVSPELAHDAEATVAEAERLCAAIGRPNVMIKIPGTLAGLRAIERCTGDGLNVNVTLLFEVARYEEVIEAFMRGLERRAEEGHPLDHVASVASFFVSRVDGKVDAFLERKGGRPALLHQAAVANAAMAYAAFERAFRSPRWARLAGRGAKPQRPLWASTSTKDPRLPDTFYVEALVAPNTVNTLPPDTFAAYRDHGRPELRIPQAIAAAPGQLAALAEAGVDLDRVTRELEQDGVEKFAASYRSLLAGIEAKSGALVGGR
ncbi:MAG: transaldolase [Gemmatimonadales bacterium]